MVPTFATLQAQDKVSVVSAVALFLFPQSGAAAPSPHTLGLLQGFVVFLQHEPGLGSHEAVGGVGAFPRHLAHTCARDEVIILVTGGKRAGRKKRKKKKMVGISSPFKSVVRCPSAGGAGSASDGDPLPRNRSQIVERAARNCRQMTLTVFGNLVPVRRKWHTYFSVYQC